MGQKPIVGDASTRKGHVGSNAEVSVQRRADDTTSPTELTDECEFVRIATDALKAFRKDRGYQNTRGFSTGEVSVIVDALRPYLRAHKPESGMPSNLDEWCKVLEDAQAYRALQQRGYSDD